MGALDGVGLRSGSTSPGGEGLERTTPAQSRPRGVVAVRVGEDFFPRPCAERAVHHVAEGTRAGAVPCGRRSPSSSQGVPMRELTDRSGQFVVASPAASGEASTFTDDSAPPSTTLPVSRPRPAPASLPAALFVVPPHAARNEAEENGETELRAAHEVRSRPTSPLRGTHFDARLPRGLVALTPHRGDVHRGAPSRSLTDPCRDPAKRGPGRSRRGPAPPRRRARPSSGGRS